MTEYYAKRLISRFFSRIDKNGPNGCWVWTGCKNESGYGYFWEGIKPVRAHRFAWELFVGPIPKDKLICHKCDNPSCVNPDHLFCGTPRDNTEDMMAKGRARIGLGQTSYLNPSNIPLVADYDDLSELRIYELGAL